MKFDDIISPESRRDFFSEYWNKKPAVIRGDAQKFDGLPPSSDLPAMCAGTLDQRMWHRTPNLSAEASYAHKDGKIVGLNSVPISMYAQLFNSGYSFCFNDVSHSSESLNGLVKEAATLSEFRSNIVVTCYLTPSRSAGVLHYDHQHVFFLQREGTKYWRISEKAAVKNPYENFLYPNASQTYFDEMEQKGYKISIPAECGFRDIKLEVGDVLYVPPGFYHMHHTKSERSFHYSLTIESVSFWNLFISSLQIEFLKNCSEFNEDIRTLDNQERTAHLEAQLDELKRQIEGLTVEQLENSYKKMSQ